MKKQIRECKKKPVCRIQIKNALIVFLLFQLANISSFGQYQFVDYMSGYYITKTNDTIRGYIGIPSFPDSSSVILYKSDKSSISEFIKASDIKQYERNSTIHISKELKLNNKVESFFVEPIIEDKLSLYTLWIHVYEVPNYKDKQYMYLTDRENYTLNLDGLPNYFKKIIILKLDDSNCLVLPERRYNIILSQYLSKYPSFALKIINNDFGKDDIEVLVKEFNNWNKRDLQVMKQDSVAANILEKKLNKYSASKLSIEVAIAYNSIKYNYLSLQDIDDLFLRTVNLENDISYSIGLKYSIFNSFQLKAGWQTDKTTIDLDYLIAKENTIIYAVDETFEISRNKGYLSLMHEGKSHFIGGGIEVDKYGIKSTNRTHNHVNPDESYYRPLSELNFPNNTKLNIQLFAGFKIYTKFGLRINPYISYAKPLIKPNELITAIELKELSAGLIFEYKIF